MKHVRVEATGTGNYLDPRAYLGLLPTLSAERPPGARAFAADPDHYDFHGPRCVKDLVLDTLQHGTADGEDWLQLGFRHNCWKHEEDLSIRYVGLSTLTPDPADWTGFGPVTLDEILPCVHGCSHEIGFIGGALTVVSRDLTATWTEADCPDN
ncbi:MULTISPECIES: hypothetical protein [Amycolatopsis]|uniref:Uncharacterized protein n=1 Tax=Amycolatopsis albidoflavus TaxID=102226 RepID=A0ABW5I6P0_9PSEU